MAFDPVACGARCDVCILATKRDGQPVASEIKGAAITVIADVPGDQEVKDGRPLVGPAGIEFQAALKLAGGERKDVNIINAISCKPPGGKLSRLMDRLTKENRKRVAAGEAPLPSPSECCRPRMLHDIAVAGARDLIVMGKTAYESALPGPHKPIDDVQGNMWTGAVALPDGPVAVRALISVHPSKVLHEMRWRDPFRRSMARALRWFAGQSTWTEPTAVYQPDAVWFRDVAVPWLMQQPILYTDTETDSIEPLIAGLDSIQFGIKEWGISIAFRSIESAGRPHLYSKADERILRSACEHVLTKHPCLCGHNAGSYDRQVFWAAGYQIERTADHCIASGLPPVGPIHAALDTDTLLVARYVMPDLRHSLGFQGSYWTDVHEWKSDGKDPKDNMTRWVYGLKDAVVNARMGEPLIERARQQYAKSQRCDPEMRPKMPERVERVSGAGRCSLITDPVLIHDHQLQAVGVEMHGLGVKIDQQRRMWMEGVLRGEEGKWLIRLQTALVEAGHKHMAGFVEDEIELAMAQAEARGDLYRLTAKQRRIIERRHLTYDGRGSPIFNPRSTTDMKRLLYDEWDLPLAQNLPDSALYAGGDEDGDRSVGDAVLRAYLSDITIPEPRHRILHALRRAKKTRSMYSRFLRKLVPYDEWKHGLEVHESKGKDRDSYPGMVVWPDGRARFGWNSAGTGVGRYSSGGRPARMNFQTIPEILRSCFVPEDGNVFVGADLAAIHLVIIANLWRIPSLVDDFTQGRDPHVTLAEMISPGFRQLDGQQETEIVDGVKRVVKDRDWRGDAKKVRNTAKSLRYAGAYGAEVPTIHATMTRTEDGEGVLVNRKLTVQMVRDYYHAWMGREPEWKRNWKNEVRLFREHGYLLSPVMGRRADFTDGEDMNKLYNYRVLSCEGDIMGVATCQVRNRLLAMGLGQMGGGQLRTGIVGQFHDAILIECPRESAPQVKALLTTAMNVAVPGWPVPITAEAKVGANWKEV